jgi:hypothetical protein
MKGTAEIRSVSQKDLLETMLLGGTGPVLDRWRDAHLKDTVQNGA